MVARSDPNPYNPGVSALAMGSDGVYDEVAVVAAEQSWVDPVLGVTQVPSTLVGPVPTAS